jgi:hypothetical protein
MHHRVPICASMLRRPEPRTVRYIKTRASRLKELLAGALVTFSGVVGWLYVENGISLDKGTENMARYGNVGYTASEWEPG